MLTLGHVRLLRPRSVVAAGKARLLLFLGHAEGKQQPKALFHRIAVASACQNGRASKMLKTVQWAVSYRMGCQQRWTACQLLAPPLLL